MCSQHYCITLSTDINDHREYSGLNPMLLSSLLRYSVAPAVKPLGLGMRQSTSVCFTARSTYFFFSFILSPSDPWIKYHFSSNCTYGTPNFFIQIFFFSVHLIDQYIFPSKNLKENLSL